MGAGHGHTSYSGMIYMQALHTASGQQHAKPLIGRPCFYREDAVVARGSGRASYL